MNYARMKKEEIIWMASHKCVAHGIRYIEHPNCYQKEEPEKQKTGFIDIEASNLKGDFGITLCVCILDLKTEELFTRAITKTEVFSEALDKEVLKDTLKEMRKFDRLVGYYASNRRFDIPFLRTRSVYHNLDFPEFGEIVMEDMYPVVRDKFALSRSRLETASRVLVGESNKTHWSGKHWIRAIQGNKDSLAYIADHCQKDVQDLKKLYCKIYKFNRKANTSI